MDRFVVVLSRFPQPFHQLHVLISHAFCIIFLGMASVIKDVCPSMVSPLKHMCPLGMGELSIVGTCCCCFELSRLLASCHIESHYALLILTLSNIIICTLTNAVMECSIYLEVMGLICSVLGGQSAGFHVSHRMPRKSNCKNPVLWQQGSQLTGRLCTTV